MKKLYILKDLLLVVPLILFLQSCKKETPLSVDKQSKFPNVTVDEARNWVKNNKPTLSIGNENWKKANIVESANNEKGNELLRVPINETLLEDKTWIIRDLIFQKDSLGQVVCDVYKIIPNADYISKKTGENRSAAFKREFIDNNDFTGQILLFTIDNQLIRGRKYVNGKLEFELEKKRRRNYGALMSGNPTSTELGAPETCNDPNDGCRNEKGGGGGYSWVNQLEEVNITAPAKPNPGYTPPSYFGGNIPPGDIYNVSKPGGGGGGGSDGTNPSYPVKKDIIDSLTNYPCAQDLLRQLPLLKNDIATLINSTFNGNCDMNITFVPAVYPVSPNGGYTDGDQTVTDLTLKNGYNYDAGFSMSSKIRINQDVLSHATKEYILITMYHEALHAYLSVEKSRLGNTFATKYPDVNLEFVNINGTKFDFTKNIFVSSHSQMGLNFYNQLANTIKLYNPNLPESTVQAMASAGIFTTSNDQKLLNENERDTRKNKQSGSKCP